MRWFSFLAVFMLIVRSLAPCCFADMTDTSHAHMFLGVVSHALFGDTHTPAVPCHPTPTTPNFDSGMLLFFPQSDWQTFLAEFFLGVFNQITLLIFLIVLLARLALHALVPRLTHLFLFDPPPRRTTS